MRGSGKGFGGGGRGVRGGRPCGSRRVCVSQYCLCVSQSVKSVSRVEHVVFVCGSVVFSACVFLGGLSVVYCESQGGVEGL